MLKKLKLNSDDRGTFVEVFKFPEDGRDGQISFSTSKPGVVRGNHYHQERKLEKFCVISGKAELKQRNRETGEIIKHIFDGENPEVVDILLNHTHNIKNIGDDVMYLLIWANEIFNPDDPDTYAEEV
ncbi:MAG TPA: hypothetical protein VJB67_03335 [Patescibacteria group bacterium]|nr:hypothetical protein [Patescibacteria group bacterium]